jgi:hypothetical protein
MTPTIRLRWSVALAATIATLGACSSNDDERRPCPECVYPTAGRTGAPEPPPGTVATGGTGVNGGGTGGSSETGGTAGTVSASGVGGSVSGAGGDLLFGGTGGGLGVGGTGGGFGVGGTGGGFGVGGASATGGI